MLDVLPTCWRYCDTTAVRPVKGTSPNASRYDTRAANPLDEAIAKIKVSHSRVFRSSFAQKSFSILLDTHTLREQDHVEVSPFEARLPLRSPNAVSLKVKLHIERKEGTTCPLLFPRVRPLPPVRRTGLQTQDASGSKGNTTHAQLARCEWEF